MAELLKAIYNCISDINITGDFRVGDIAHSVVDISKTKNTCV